MKGHVRKTSIEAYHIIRDNGLLSKLRLQVYEYLFEHGPCTQRQVYKGLGDKFRYFSSWTPRFSELKRLGVIDEIDEVTCVETGMKVVLYDVNENLPRKAAKGDKVHTLIVQINNLEIKIQEKKKQLNMLTAPKYKPSDDNLSFEL